MDAAEVKEVYNKQVKTKFGGDYDHHRWFSDALKEAGYQMTLESIRHHFLERSLLPPRSGEARRYHSAICGVGDSFNDCLELGPGAGTWTKLFLEKCPDAKFDLVDISSEMLKLAKENLDKLADSLCHSEASETKRRISLATRSFAKVYPECNRRAQDDKEKNIGGGGKENENCGSIRYFEMDFLDFEPDKQYDLFFSSRALEYIPDKKGAVIKIAGLLKSGGQGFIITKTPKYLRAKLLGREISELHQGQIAPRKLKQLLLETGFKNIEIYPAAMSFPLFQSPRLNLLLFSVFYKERLNFLSQFFAESYCVKFEK